MSLFGIGRRYYRGFRKNRYNSIARYRMSYLKRKGFNGFGSGSHLKWYAKQYLRLTPRNVRRFI